MTQNFFVRLKNYQTVVNDQRENHATEVLAGCLNLSLVLRAAFLKFLGEKLDGIQDAEAWTVRTQIEPIQNSRWDLTLERMNPNRLIVIEAKVGDSLEAGQVKKYLDYLEPRAGRLVALVEAGRTVPAKEIYRDLPIIRWDEVAAAFNLAVGTMSGSQSTDSLLAWQFAEYLDIEQITMTCSPKDLLGFEQGLRANRALESLFGEVSARLSEIPEIGRDIKEIHRQGSYDRIRWSNDTFYVELHFRVDGLENWKGGHTLALGAGTFSPPCGENQVEALYAKLKEPDWQIWMPSKSGQIWGVASQNQKSDKIYAYRPLVGEDCVNGDHRKPLRPWLDLPWVALADLAAAEFKEAIIAVQSIGVGQPNVK